MPNSRQEALELQRLDRLYDSRADFGEDSRSSSHLIEDQLQEDILHLPKETVLRIFSQRTALLTAEAGLLLTAFAEEGKFSPRLEVESDRTRVQALPVVVVRNKSGDLLRLRRRERSTENPLHEKLVIWAGGHVRKEDGDLGNAIEQCALREIQEELRLSLKSADLEFLGATYLDAPNGDKKKTSQHVALVYQWQAKSDDVAVALSTAEFFERRGASLSGQFVKPEVLAKEVEDKKLVEPWSVEILRRLLPNSAPLARATLFD